MHNHRFSSRYFFYGTLVGGVAPSGRFGSTPSLSALGYRSPNKKLNVACLGMGIRGLAIVLGAAATENVGHPALGHDGATATCEMLWSGEIDEVKKLHAWTGGIYGISRTSSRSFRRMATR